MGLGQEIARAYVTIGADSKGLTTGLSKAKGELTSFAKGLGGLGGIIGLGVGAMVAQLARMGVNMAFELSQMAAQHDQLAQSMSQLADQYGGDAERIMDALRRTSGGAVSDTQLILAANRAMMLGISADSEKLGQLMEVARYRGRAMGLSTAQAFSDIVTGIGRMSPLILDNLGIVINAEQRFGEYAKSIGKTADALSDVEKKQVLLNGVLADGMKQIEAAGGISENAAGKVAALGASWDNLKVTIGQGIDTSKPVGALTELINKLNDALKYRQDVQRQYELLYGESAGALQSSTSISRDVENVIPNKEKELARLEKALSTAKTTQAELNAAMAATKEAGAQPLGNLVDDAAEADQRVADLTAQINELRAALYGLQSEGGAVFGVINTAANAGRAAIGKLSETLRVDQRPQWLKDYTAAGGTAIANPMMTWENAQDKAMKTLMRGAEVEKFKTDQLERDTLAQKANADAMRDRQQAYDSLISTIKGLMTATSATELDMLQTKAGTYDDKWDEYGRRMQDVIENGASSPWAQKYFPGMAGDDLKRRAMENQQAFYGGDFSQMSKEDYDAMVRELAEDYQKQKAGEAGKTQLAQDVASLLGIGGGEVKQFMGIAKPEEAGATFNAGVIQGATDSGIAEPLAKAWRDDISKNAETLKAVGQAAYQEVFKGIQKAIEEGTSFVQLLAEATAPVVAGIIAREKNRGGATP
jgi:hypothetical protein